MVVLIFCIIYLILWSITAKPLFEKAGEEGWKAYVPGLNFATAAKIVGHQPMWALWLLFPIVNLFMMASLNVDLVRSFGRFGFGDAALAVIYAPIKFFQIGKEENDKFIGPNYTLEKDYNQQIADAASAGDKGKLHRLQTKNPYQKGVVREWAEAIVFAVFAAAFIRMFLIEPFVIPTPSMEGSLLVGDFLFVSKVHYGARTPETVLQVPLLHNTVPVIGSESYLHNPKLKMRRLPKISPIKRNDPVVFNYPEGDSIYITPQRNFSVNDIRRQGKSIEQHNQVYGLRVRPVDKRDHYVKRCIAIPGDKLEIKANQVYLNDQAVENPKMIQHTYKVRSSKAGFKNFIDDMEIYWQERAALAKNPTAGYFALSQDEIDALKAWDPEIQIEYMARDKPGGTFPHDPKNFPDWSMDNFGPLEIPKAGESVVITPMNIALYERIINVYEGNDLEVKNGRIFINGQQATNYTFEQDYYWMMGDNRHNSEDSRVWGFVPEDHVVGKPLFIWFSTKDGNIGNGIRWNRIFKSAQQF